MPTRPFRFGVVAARAQSGAAWAEMARRVEASGYAIILMPDRLTSVLAPIPALAAAAAATTTLRIGTFVMASGRHNAAQIAHDTATLDFLSGGRFELGLGTGVSEEDFRRAGLDYAPAGARVTGLGETIGAVKEFWREFAQDGPQSYPAPVQRPGPPLLIGGGGKRLLALAAREADIVSVGTGRGALGPEALAERVGWLREAAGERFAALELSINLAAVIGERPIAPAMRWRARTFLGTDPEELVAQRSPFVLAGSTDAMAEQLLALREELGISYFMTSEDQLGVFTPVMERLIGR